MRRKELLANPADRQEAALFAVRCIQTLEVFMSMLLVHSPYLPDSGRGNSP
jgi:hypothetical protein